VRFIEKASKGSLQQSAFYSKDYFMKQFARRRGTMSQHTMSRIAVNRQHVRLNVMLEPARKAKLAALTALTGKSAGVILGEALDTYVAGLPAEDRRAVEALAKRSRRGNSTS